MMSVNFWKTLAAAALGGAIVGITGASIDPEHFGESLQVLGGLAASGAVTAVIHLFMKSPTQR